VAPYWSGSYSDISIVAGETYEFVFPSIVEPNGDDLDWKITDSDG
jgi:hypothetical protein